MAVTTEQYLTNNFLKKAIRAYKKGVVPEKEFKENLTRLLKRLDPIVISGVVKSKGSLSVFVSDLRKKNETMLRLDLCLHSISEQIKLLKECCHFIALLHSECNLNKPSKCDSDLDEMFDVPAPHQTTKVQTAHGEFNVSELKDGTNFKSSQLNLTKFVDVVSKSKLEKFQVDLLNAFDKSIIPPTREVLIGDFNMDLHKGGAFLTKFSSSNQVYANLIAQNKTNPNLNLKKENSMKITRPVLVGNINILEASPEVLGNIIREANKQITQMADLAVESKHFENEQNSLKEVVKLCVTQLDKDIK